MKPEEPTLANDSPPESQDHRRHSGVLAAAIRLVSGLTLLSRVAGLARDVVTAQLFGNTAVGSAFSAAFAIPNMFRRLFGEGAISAAFLPEFVKARRSDLGLADSFATLTFRLVALITGGITLAVELVLLLIILLAPAGADPERLLSVKLIALMLPMMPMVCLTAILGGILQSHGRFGPTAAAPILLNLFQIAAGLWFFFVPGSTRAAGAYAVGAAAVAATIAQVAWSLWALRALIRWRGPTEAARGLCRVMFRRFVPVLVGLGTVQLNTLLDTLWAMWPIWVGATMLGFIYPLDETSNSILFYSTRLYQFPLGVFGIAVATAVFPLLSIASANADDFRAVLRRGIRLSLLIGLPASIGLVLVRHDLVALLFGGERTGFDADGLERAAAVVLGFAPGVWAYSLNHVLVRAFYARGDTSTPMRVSVAMVAVNLVLNLSLIWSLREAGLAWATSLSAVVQCVVLSLLAARLLDARPFDGKTLAAALRLTLAAVLMGLLVHWAMTLAGAVLPTIGIDHDARVARFIRVAVGVLVGVSSYAGLLLPLRAPELRWILQRPPRGADGRPIGIPLD